MASEEALEQLTPAQLATMEHAKYHNAQLEGSAEDDGAAFAASGGDTSAGKERAMPVLPEGKQRAADSAEAPANLQPVSKYEDAFPSLGIPTHVVKPNTLWGAGPQVSGVSNGVNGQAVPAGKNSSFRPNVQLPGKYEESVVLPRSSIKTGLKKNLTDTLKDFTRGTGVNIEARHGANQDNEQVTTFLGQGTSQESVRRVLRKALQEVGRKDVAKIPIPATAKAQIIGKGGAKIKEIQRLSGARIQLLSSGEDDETVEAVLEGDPVALRIAVTEIDNIIGQRSTDVKLTVKTIPPELFPFLQTHFSPDQDVSIEIPHYHSWTQEPPASQVRDFVPREGYHIALSGSAEKARQAKARLEALSAELQERLVVEELLGIENERHQFVLGKHESAQHFLQNTGCSIILPPPSHDSETIHIVGPSDRIEIAKDRAMDLAGEMVSNQIDVAKIYQGPREAQAQYLNNLSRYMQTRNAFDGISRQHDAQLAFPRVSSQPWTLWTRDSKSGVRARTDVLGTVSAHPPARFRNLNIHPFYQREMQHHAPYLQSTLGVHLVVGEEDDVLLVYEGSNGYTFPQRRPTNEELALFGETLLQAEQYLLDKIGEQGNIVDRTIEGPAKYREKLQRFGNRQQHGRFPVQTQISNGTHTGVISVKVRGPEQDADETARQIEAFLADQIKDEAERDYTTSCTFPKALRGRLIGKEGETINKIRDDFDVEVKFQAEDDTVEIRGPPAKANAAKAHIISLAKKAEDETTHTLIIPSRFHGELIGKGGSQVQKYQERYGVSVFFPLADADDRSGRRAAQGPDEVVIKGSRKNADLARDDLRALYMVIQENSHTARISVSLEQVPLLIGRDGAEARALRLESGADIEFPSPPGQADDSGRASITIKGSREAVDKAKSTLEERIRVYDKTVTHSLEVDRKYYRLLIGQNGENLKKLVTAAGGDPSQPRRIIQIPDTTSSEQLIRLTGPQEVVEKLSASINAFIESQGNRVTETIIVPQERHGAIIGPRGSVKQKLEADHQVSIKVPARDSQGPAAGQIKISGLPENVAKVKASIADILGPGPSVVSMDVPTRLHHTIADGGRFFSILRKDLGVTVDHKGRRPPPVLKPVSKTAHMPLITDSGIPSADLSNVQWEVVARDATTEDATIPWVFKGGEDNVQQAKKLLEAAIVAANDSITGYLFLPDPRTSHSLVVGPGGASIRKIRDMTGCNPRVPLADQGGPIELSGSPDKVQAAKELILKAVADGLNRRTREPRSPT